MALSSASIVTLPGSALIQRIVLVAENIVKAFRHRREIRELAELDDRLLKDIGLARSDVEGALAKPLHHNPSRSLVRRSEAEAPPNPRVRPVVPFAKPAE